MIFFFRLSTLIPRHFCYISLNPPKCLRWTFILMWKRTKKKRSKIENNCRRRKIESLATTKSSLLLLSGVKLNSFLRLEATMQSFSSFLGTFHDYSIALIAFCPSSLQENFFPIVGMMDESTFCAFPTKLSFEESLWGASMMGMQTNRAEYRWMI